jgi:hypothetical protein
MWHKLFWMTRRDLGSTAYKRRAILWLDEGTSFHLYNGLFMSVFPAVGLYAFALGAAGIRHCKHNITPCQGR